MVPDVLHNFPTASTQSVTPLGPSRDGIISTNSCPDFCFGKRVRCSSMSVSPLPKGGEPQGRVRVNPAASALHATTDHKSTGANRKQFIKVFRILQHRGSGKRMPS
jgi:hypothetical protein